MNEKELYSLRFPVGEYTKPDVITPEHIAQWIKIIAEFPDEIKTLTHGLSVDAKNWKYRPDGWTLKQVVHHCADSHMNSIIRFKWSLTEDSPKIKAYFEDRWSELPDAFDDDLEDTLLLLTGLHRRWVNLLNRLSDASLERTFFHPEHNKEFTLKETIGSYAWHCQHHLAHIRLALESGGKYN